MNLKEFVQHSREALATLYPGAEANALTGMLCSEFLGVAPHEFLVNPELQPGDAALEKALCALERLCGSEPLQYVLGRAEFYGRSFCVNPSVLIPRPETEYMCRLALQMLLKRKRQRAVSEVDAPLRVLDLCTGSGCIAWTLACELPGTEVVAVDISEDALAVARGQKLSETGGVVAPRFLQADVLDPAALVEKLRCLGYDGFDLVVSNPPYVLQKERAEMRANVLEHEPELALFVPDSDFGLFYRPVAEISSAMLYTDCSGIVEINEAFGPQTAEIFRTAGLCNAHVVQDLNGRDRFVSFANVPGNI